MKLPSYLYTSRHGVYYFRIVIPLALRLYFPHSEIRRSLHTSDRRQATRLAKAWSVEIDDLFSAINDTMDYQDIRKLVQDHMQTRIGAFEARLAKKGPFFSPMVYVQMFGPILATHKEPLQYTYNRKLTIPEEVQAEANKLLSKHGIDLDYNSRDYRLLYDELARMNKSLRPPLKTYPLFGWVSKILNPELNCVPSHHDAQTELVC